MTYRVVRSSPSVVERGLNAYLYAKGGLGELLESKQESGMGKEELGGKTEVGWI